VRLVGWDIIHGLGYVQWSVAVSTGFFFLGIYAYLWQGFTNISFKEAFEVSKKFNILKIEQKANLEFQQMVQNLEEGIVLVVDNKISFENNKFSDLIKN